MWALIADRATSDIVVKIVGLIIIIIIRRRFLTRRNTPEVITRARINAMADDLSHKSYSVSTHIS